MVEVTLDDITQELLNDPVLGEQDIDAKIRRLLRAEFLRQLARYRRTDQALVQKYGMKFDDFVAQDIVRQRGYKWEVEQDAMEWETAIGGIQTIERKLQLLNTIADG